MVSIKRLPASATTEGEWVELGTYPRAASAATGSGDFAGRMQAVTPSGDLVIWVFYKDGAAYSTTTR